MDKNKPETNPDKVPDTPAPIHNDPDELVHSNVPENPLDVLPQDPDEAIHQRPDITSPLPGNEIDVDDILHERLNPDEDI